MRTKEEPAKSLKRNSQRLEFTFNHTGESDVLKVKEENNSGKECMINSIKNYREAQ